MPKRVPMVAITVVRDGKRITPEPGKKAFDFTQAEIDSVTAQHPGAFRKAVNEDPQPTDETAPEGEAGATAADQPKKSAKTKKADAAKADSGSKAATADAGETKPSSTDAADQVGDGAASEDDDI